MIISAALLTVGCFFYDSNWGAQKRAQVNAAKRYTPVGLRRDAEGAGAPRRQGARSVLRARVYAARGYVVETANWQKRFAEIVARANESLTSELGTRVELESSAPWEPSADDTDLYALMNELEKTDPGEGADLVIGLTGSLPKLVFSFHQLGIGRNPGKHVILRASNDAVEYEALQSALDELDESERAKVYRARLLHKATTVLLHEIGHTLGSPHSLDRSDVMHSQYDVSIRGFAPGTRELLRLGLEQRTARWDARVSALGDALRRAPVGHWAGDERDALLARLDAVAMPAQNAVVAPSAAARTQGQSAAPSDVPVTLRPEHRARYRDAVAALKARRFDEALNTAQPLFDEYPSDYAVQDLRCQIALGRLDYSAARGECEALMRLLPAKSK